MVKVLLTTWCRKLCNLTDKCFVLACFIIGSNFNTAFVVFERLACDLGCALVDINFYFVIHDEPNESKPEPFSRLHKSERFFARLIPFNQPLHANERLS